MHRELSLHLPSGLALRCVDVGPRGGVPVVMLHGLTDSWWSFAPVLPHLPAGVRAIALSMRGHGDSDRPLDGYTTGHFAQDVAEALDALGLDSAYVVGHSLGATVAMRLALEHPARVRGLLLLGAFASYADNAGLVEFVRSEVEPLADAVPRALAHAFQVSTLAQPIAPELLDRFVGESLKVPARVWRAAFAALLQDTTGQRAGAIAAPVRLAWGARDALCGELDRVRLGRALPHAGVTVHAEFGHALHWEAPMLVAGELGALLAVSVAA